MLHVKINNVVTETRGHDRTDAGPRQVAGRSVLMQFHCAVFFRGEGVSCT
jgi:hypothetical protein